MCLERFVIPSFSNVQSWLPTELGQLKDEMATNKTKDLPYGWALGNFLWLSNIADSFCMINYQKYPTITMFL